MIGPYGLSAACVAEDTGQGAPGPQLYLPSDSSVSSWSLQAPPRGPQSSLWTPASAQLVTCQLSFLSADLNPPTPATHPSACLSLSTSGPCLPGVCHSAHQIHGPPPNPGLLFFQQSSDSKGGGRPLRCYHSLSRLLLNTTACLSGAQMAPWLPAPS